MSYNPDVAYIRPYRYAKDVHAICNQEPNLDKSVHKDSKILSIYLEMYKNVDPAHGVIMDGLLSNEHCYYIHSQNYEKLEKILKVLYNYA